MKKRVHLLPVAAVMVALLLGVFGCQKDNKMIYSPPPWLGGSSIETLEDRGNYTIYLKLMEMANYTDRISKQLNTLFVPNDDAFKAYFAQAGIESVDKLTKDQAVQLFTLHVLANPRSRYQLIYEYLWAEEQGPHGEYAALFFRKPTNSTSLPYYETATGGTDKGKTILMYTGNKLIPLFTIDYFEDFFGALDGSDYTFMYPDSKWEDNMNWGPALILDDPLRDKKPNETAVERRNAAAIRTANGFIYLLDRVVPPQKNMEEYLHENQDKYGLYYGMMQRFAKYGSPKRFPERNNEMGYQKSYDMVSNIAEEQGAFPGNETRQKDMFSGYIPNNQVLTDYLNRTVLKTYPSIDSVPDVTIYYILQTQLGRSIGLLSKISQSYFNSFGDPMTIQKSDIISSHMCSNGMIYEMNKVLEPNVFKTVPGELFFNSNYSTLLYAMNTAGILASLSNPAQKVTLLAATNDELYNYGVRFNDTKATPTIEWRGADGTWNTMKTEELTAFCEDHIYNGIMDFSGKGYLEMASGNFVSYDNNSIVGPENQYKKEHSAITGSKPNDLNGILYYIDKPIKSKFLLGNFFTKDPDLSAFTKLLKSNKLLTVKADPFSKSDTIAALSFLAETSYWTAFAPTNAAMAAAQAAGILPKDKTDAMKNFLLYHFVRKNVIFDDGGNKENGMGVTGTYDSEQILLVDPILGTTYVPLKIVNEENNLSVEDASGQIVKVDHAVANILTRKGVGHKINSVLKIK